MEENLAKQTSSCLNVRELVQASGEPQAPGPSTSGLEVWRNTNQIHFCPFCVARDLTSTVQAQTIEEYFWCCFIHSIVFQSHSNVRHRNICLSGCKSPIEIHVPARTRGALLLDTKEKLFPRQGNELNLGSAPPSSSHVKRITTTAGGRVAPCRVLCHVTTR